MTYFLADGEQQKGPFEVGQLLSQGLRPNSMVWCAGMPQWDRADRVDELKSLFWPATAGSPAPPPPPINAGASTGGYVADAFAQHSAYQQAGTYPIPSATYPNPSATYPNPGAAFPNPGAPYPNPGNFAGSPGIYYQGPGLPPRDVNGTKIAAGICAILFGSLGVHKFVIGATNAGITMLLVSILTFGIGWIVMHIIGIVEGITYLTKSDAEFYQTYMLDKKAWF
jgi:TM2 domain-containing membrane protein YozV